MINAIKEKRFVCNGSSRNLYLGNYLNANIDTPVALIEHHASGAQTFEKEAAQFL